MSYTYNAGNQLISDGVRTYTYDNNGNRIGWTDGQKTFTLNYNPMNRLTGVVDGTNTDLYTYNGDGKRLASTRNGIQKRFVLDVSGNMEHVLADTDPSGNILRYYVHGLGLLYAIDAADYTRHYYHYDATGSTLALTDGAQAITDKYVYNPFGVTLGQEGDTPNPFRYVGQYGVAQEQNGLIFMRARFYDSNMGVFISKDPRKGKG